MLKKLGLIALGFLLGIIIGGVATMAYTGFGLSRGMFMLQDVDIVRAEDAATQAYLNESPEIGIWAIENYLDFFDGVINQRMAAIDETTDKARKVFLLVEPKRRWISYVRLGILYEKIGKEAKRDESFQKAGELFGCNIEEREVHEHMINFIKKLDEDFKPLDFDTEQ